MREASISAQVGPIAGESPALKGEFSLVSALDVYSGMW